MTEKCKLEAANERMRELLLLIWNASTTNPCLRDCLGDALRELAPDALSPADLIYDVLGDEDDEPAPEPGKEQP